ncbi:MAG: hypothetical protein C0608_03565 [Deltaproteobacteria bacterium]|nr:MAG: hypothetical protein C0608_03565 [Deltaproteobacteria bacterium]
MKRVGLYSLLAVGGAATVLSLFGLHLEGAAIFLGGIGGLLGLLHLDRELKEGAFRAGRLKGALARMVLRALPLAVAGAISWQSLPYALGGLLMPSLILIFVR